MSSSTMARSSVTPKTIASGKVSKVRSTSLKSSLPSPVHSSKSGAGTKSVVSEQVDNEANRNPFKVPPDQDIFLLRNKERERKKLEREQERNLKIHEKTTYAGRVNAKRTKIRDLMKEGKEEGAKGGSDDEQASWKLSMTKGCHIEKESINEFISRKRQMFLLQYSLAVKRDEMCKLDEMAITEERKLEKAEQYLEEDATMFDAFLKENDKNSVEAIKIAELETKVKLEKVAEIKRTSTKLMGLKSEISKLEEILKEYMTYKDFLMKLSPKEWREEYEAKQRKAKKAEKSQVSPTKTDGRPSSREMQGRKESIMKAQGIRKLSLEPSQMEDMQESSSDCDEEPELYFKDPQQLLEILIELEEQNLSLIQNSQETEETLEEFKQTIATTKQKMDHETDTLKQQVDMLQYTINREKERAAELELKARVFSFGKFKTEDQEEMMDSISKKVEEVYRACIGQNNANLSTLLMLTAIENRLEELFENIEMVPREKVQVAERAKEKERRIRNREEKMKLQKQHQEERLRKALQRSQADIKKTTGKKLVYRSQPPVIKQKEDKNQEITNREKEEQIYFFT
ncbi:cilia- and flagella-associated protein 100-like isoform X1 [Acipenser oxyrinchus oxyrinchus]|uniref:Cilia- and flagella-associated protein 100-like isoform X1 n=1 Tax=Acipenser oxyrinchus oxyrinchus TaxID=40147 RepID=A0AAD8FWG1_ACIOX|nr:cilia- and flagella-associated protein 100-like isoform X1 [Acipenser oxyrinchus oxyrinchus]